jgi:nitroreductase/NAD-dependent dihydropyrimidine dehydrogenase PreA subunit
MIMPITGIDYEKCNHCKLCVKDCPTRNFSIDDKQKKIIFDNMRCILCGHCISVCPENAILYSEMKDDALEFDEGRDPSELISFDSIFHLLRAKRSIRQYKREKVSEEKIKKVIESMRYAPTGANIRSMKCLVILDEDKIKILSDSIVDALEFGETKKRFKQEVDKGIDPIFYKAPVVLILYSKNPWDTRNSTIAMTYGMISAQTLGLGSCWIGFAHGFLVENPNLCTKITGIQTNVLGVITLGYPAVKYYRSPPRPQLLVQGFEDQSKI